MGKKEKPNSGEYNMKNRKWLMTKRFPFRKNNIIHKFFLYKRKKKIIKIIKYFNK